MLVTSNEHTELEISRYLGGEFSFVESLKMGGVGSIKILYSNGVDEFDLIDHLNLDLNYCSFQRYKLGFRIRMTKKGINVNLGVRFTEIAKIKLEITPLKIHNRFRIRIRHKAVMTIVLFGSEVTFQIPTISFKSFDNFIKNHFDQVKIERILLPFETNPEIKMLRSFWLIRKIMEKISA